jgi:hypothetical protein
MQDFSSAYRLKCAGSDLLNMGLAKTHMVAALARGLNAAGVSFTLPPTKGGPPGDGGLAVQRIAAADGHGQDGGSGGGNGGKDDQSHANKASAAAGNLLVLS